MTGSYLQHSKNTKEYEEGRWSETSNNPYSSVTKEWLDWQLGFESNVMENIPLILDITQEDLFVNPFLTGDYYDQYGFRL